MEFKYLNKEIRWFRKIDLNGRKTQVKDKSEEKVLELNAQRKEM